MNLHHSDPKGKLHSKIISSDLTNPDGEDPRSKFEEEHSQTVGEKWHAPLGTFVTAPEMFWPFSAVRLIVFMFVF